MAAIPGLIVALVVFGAFLLGAAIVKGVVARLTEGRLHAHRNAGVAYDGRRVVVPSADLFTEAVVVNTAFEHRRVEYDVGIGHGDDIDRRSRSHSRGCTGARRESSQIPPDVLLMDFAPSSIGLRVRWWIAPRKRADALDARDKVLTAVKNQLTCHGIDLPLPTQEILFHDQTEDSDGDCARQREGWPAGNTDVPASRKVADAIRHITGSKRRGVESE